MIELETLRKPEYLHVVLNHLPIYGLILGALALGIALVLKSRAAQITALVIVLIAGASAFPVLTTGQRAYRPVRALSDEAGSDWLDLHMERAEQWILVFYAVAALALAGIIAPIKWPKSAFWLAVVTLILAVISFGVALYIAEPGGRIRHTEFRPSESSPTPSQPHTH